MLFRKDIPKACIYCVRGTCFDEESILCAKKGIVSRDFKCRKFKYDPTKRIPARAKAMDFSKYDREDYSL